MCCLHRNPTLRSFVSFQLDNTRNFRTNPIAAVGNLCTIHNPLKVYLDFDLVKRSGSLFPRPTAHQSRNKTHQDNGERRRNCHIHFDFLWRQICLQTGGNLAPTPSFLGILFRKEIVSANFVAKETNVLPRRCDKHNVLPWSLSHGIRSLPNISTSFQ